MKSSFSWAAAKGGRRVGPGVPAADGGQPSDACVTVESGTRDGTGDHRLTSHAEQGSDDPERFIARSRRGLTERTRREHQPSGRCRNLLEVVDG